MMLYRRRRFSELVPHPFAVIKNNAIRYVQMKSVETHRQTTHQDFNGLHRLADLCTYDGFCLIMPPLKTQGKLLKYYC